ncbi:MAG: hypothetical protein LBS66_03160 [Rhodospirillaceae bacterium]|nr:hypothetical protein [Rhodospirillaceae bacterium]
MNKDNILLPYSSVAISKLEQAIHRLENTIQQCDLSRRFCKSKQRLDDQTIHIVKSRFDAIISQLKTILDY